MIKRDAFINESKLGKLIQGLADNHIVNIKDDHFEYCDGHILIICTYDLDLIIQKLFKIGAIKNYKNWTPLKSHDLKDIIECKSEIEAIKTPYLKNLSQSGQIANIFKIGNKFVSYKKEYIDIFKNVEYKVSDEGILPSLRIYGNGEFIGLIMPVRDQHDLLAEIIGN